MAEGDSADQFLQEELNAFERIYSELLGIAPADQSPEHRKMADQLRRRSRILAANLSASSGQLNKSCDPKTSQLDCKSMSGDTDISREGNPVTGIPDLTGCQSCHTQRAKTPPDKLIEKPPIYPSSNVVADLEADIQDLSYIADGKTYDTGDKLFLDLLDDLDAISGNTPSARQRKRARDLFSEWLFSQETIGEESGESPQKNKDSFSDYASQFDANFFAAINPRPLRHRKLHTRWRPKSSLFDCEVSAIYCLLLYSIPTDCQYTCHHKCRQSVNLDCASVVDSIKKPVKVETSLTKKKGKVVRKIILHCL